MSKAILTIDMPNSCAKCPLFLNHYSDLCCRAMNNRTINYPYPMDFRQDWCPLKEAPEQCSMRVDKIKSKSIDEFVDWIDDNFMFDTAPYMRWFDSSYCKRCQPEEVYDADRDKEMEYAWCEVTGKCRFFQDMNEVPNTKHIIKMWLESKE